MESTIKKATGNPVAFLFLPPFGCSLEILVHQFVSNCLAKISSPN